ncbi:helix-turn-helix domain-containing protein [Fibrisoma montanum]|nr:helix-turn-helix domain-containing protein [Fibrisoma montanum]
MLVLVTTFAFVQTLVVLYLLPLRHAQSRDYSYIKALLTLVILHLGIKLYLLGILHDPVLFRRLNSFTTFAYGPLVYFQYRQLLGKPLSRPVHILHLIPFFAAFALYIFSVLTQLPLKNPALFKTIFTPYGNLGVISLLLYHSYLLVMLRRSPIPSQADQSLLQRISGLFIAAGLTGKGSKLLTEWLQIEWEGHLIPYLIFGLISFVCLRFFFTQKAESAPTLSEEIAVPSIEENRQAVMYKKSGLTQDQIEEQWQALESLMEREKPYRNPELSLDDLAGRLAISRQHTSQILSVKAGKNFYVYVNEYRVQEMIRLLNQNPRGRRMAELMRQVGFQSKTTFNTYFKAVTGMSPTEYQRLVLSESKAKRAQFKNKVKQISS